MLHVYRIDYWRLFGQKAAKLKSYHVFALPNFFFNFTHIGSSLKCKYTIRREQEFRSVANDGIRRHCSRNEVAAFDER